MDGTVTKRISQSSGARAAGVPWVRMFLGGMAFLLAPAAPAAQTELVNADTPWRAFLALGPNIEKDGAALFRPGDRGARRVPLNPATDKPEECGFSRLPDSAWMTPGFDVSDWARYLRSDLMDFLGDYGVPHAAFGGRNSPAVLYLRTGFGISDPARAVDLTATVTCLGGAVVYVNGREVGRGFLPAGQVTPLTMADAYPPEAYTMDDGTTPLPELTLRTVPDPKYLPRYRRRIRTFSVKAPADVLVKGGNVLAVEIHRAPTSGPMPRVPWVHLGVHAVTLTSASGAGAIGYAQAVQGTRIWSALPEEQVAETPTTVSLLRRDEGRPVIWMRGRALRGIQCANPFDPVVPVRMAAPRNGVASGQVVVTDLAGLKGLAASATPLKGTQGEIPPGAIQIRYAAQHPAMHFCDALLTGPPPEGAKTVPVWVIVQAPKEQAPGWYTGALNVKANGKDFSAPVKLLVTGATLPDARDFSTHIGISCAADTIAAHYGVEPWSDEHLRLMQPSLRLAGQLGNDVLYVPVILGGMSVSFRNKMTGGSAGLRFRPLVRFVKDGDRLRPEFSLLEKFLDAYARHCAPPQALSLYVWEAGCSKEIGFAYENARIAGSPTRELPGRPGQPTSPLLVLQLDPQTGATKEVEAPAITDEGGEAFYKPLFEGVRAILARRGWPERAILAGLGGDLRPGQKSGELLRQWVPYVRWNLLSHFSGDPRPQDGKMIATCGLEVGLKEHPWRPAFLRPYAAAELEQTMPGAAQFLDMPTARWHWQDDSAPLVFRTLPMLWGALGHIGLDFWTHVRGVPRNTSFFTSSCALTVPGPNGAEPTVRFQMLREGVQDMEVRLMIVRGYLKLPEEQRKPYRELLDEFARRLAWSSGYLTQYELGYGWRAYVAQVQAAAAELAGAKSQAQWDRPPP